MAAKPGHTAHQIVLPSYAFNQFLYKAVFDAEAFPLFMENTAATLKNHRAGLD